MQPMRKLVSSLATRVSQLKTSVRRASGSNSIPEICITNDEDEIEPEDEMGILEAQFPILRSRHTDIFYMAQCLGPAYQGLISSADRPYATSYCPADTKSNGHKNPLIAKPNEMWLAPCPRLLMRNMRHLFQHPCSDFRSCMNVSMIGMGFQEADIDKALRSFFLIACHESCEILYNGYWADFINPMTGRAHFWPAQATRRQCREAQLFGQGIAFNTTNGCTVIESEKGDQYTGIIFTDMPYKVLETWLSKGVMDDLP